METPATPIETGTQEITELWLMLNAFGQIWVIRIGTITPGAPVHGTTTTGMTTTTGAITMATGITPGTTMEAEATTVAEMTESGKDGKVLPRTPSLS